MKVQYIDLNEKRISISGAIDKEFIIQPGKYIILEKGATFRGVKVGGKILFNNEYELQRFSLTKEGNALELVPLLPKTPLSISEVQSSKGTDSIPTILSLLQKMNTESESNGCYSYSTKSSDLPALDIIEKPHSLLPKRLVRSIATDKLPTIKSQTSDQSAIIPSLFELSDLDLSLVEPHILPMPSSPDWMLPKTVDTEIQSDDELYASYIKETVLYDTDLLHNTQDLIPAGDKSLSDIEPTGCGCVIL